MLYRLSYRAVEKNKVTHLLDILSILVLADDLDLAAVGSGPVGSHFIFKIRPLP